jgi:hypothetical protein
VTYYTKSRFGDRDLVYFVSLPDFVYNIITGDHFAKDGVFAVEVRLG